MNILVINIGSSNCKIALYKIENENLYEPKQPLWKCEFEHSERLNYDLMKEKLESIPLSHSEIHIVGHRIVHGGSEFHSPVFINAAVKETIEKFSPLAPLHNPLSLKGIEILESLFKETPQFAVFDTAFHTSLDETASTYSGPYQWKEVGIKRYGFHGISYQYCASRAAFLLQKDPSDLKIVCCHLGNGTSIAAIRGGYSIDTTMGFTPVEGLMMGSRSGSIDPSILLFLQKEYGQSIEELYQILNYHSGLKGISGVSNDMRDILELCSKGHSKSILALNMYIHSLKRNIGAMAAVLGDLDALLFTGGIGENCNIVRQLACIGLSHFGIDLDESKNHLCKHDEIISTNHSKVKILVVATEEDWCIAHTIKQKIET